MQEDDELVYFTEEELSQLSATIPKNNYFVYYEKKTGNILSVTNEKTEKLENFLEIEKSVAVPFLEGTQSINDYCVAYDEKTGLTIILKEEEFFIRRTNIFEIISPVEDTTDKEFIVEWHKPTWGWNFYLTPKAKARLREEGLVQYIAVFITDAEELNLIFRTIYIDASLLLLKEKVYHAFISEKEHNIDNLSVSSKLVFQTYGLTKVYDNN
ncbi:MAG: hypothetical protein RLZZ196_3013 [Bacteroidota bacterium]|jgi:hypothetical protein